MIDSSHEKEQQMLDQSQKNNDNQSNAKIRLNPFAILEAEAIGKIINLQAESQQDDYYKPLERVKVISHHQDQDNCLHSILLPSDYAIKNEQNVKNSSYKISTMKVIGKKALKAINLNQSIVLDSVKKTDKVIITNYAVEQCLYLNNQILIVCSSSNNCFQRYRQLKEQFMNVGLNIGQTNVDMSSKCIITTNSRLRILILNQSNALKKIKWIVFQDIVASKQWEELIICLPQNIRLILFMKHLKNLNQFGEWLVKLKVHPVHILTDLDQNPIQHYICPISGEGLFLVQNQNRQFSQQNFTKLTESFKSVSPNIKEKKKRQVILDQNILKTVRCIVQQQLCPAMILCQSKRQIQSKARLICTKYDLTTKFQKQRIQLIYSRSLMLIDQQDRTSSVLQIMRQILKKGVGIYHNGLLPLILQITELLIMQELVKIVVTDDSFEINTAIPIRTTVFTSLKKKGSSDWLSSQQYKHYLAETGQGKWDKKGMSIIMMEQEIERHTLKEILKYQNQKINLKNSITLTPHAFLSHQSLQFIDTQYILSRSFMQFQQDKALPVLREEETNIKQKCSSIIVHDDTLVTKLYGLNQNLSKLKQKLKKMTFVADRIIPFLSVGRLVGLKDEQMDWGYGVVVNVHKKQMAQEGKQNTRIYLVDCLVHIKPQKEYPSIYPAKYNETGQNVILTFLLSCISNISTLKLSVLPNNLCLQVNKQLVAQTLSELISKEVPILNIESHTAEAEKLKDQIAKCQHQIQEMSYIDSIYKEYCIKKDNQDRLKQIKKQIKSKSAIVFRKSLKAHKKIMKKLNILNKGVVTPKGKVATCINSDYNYLLTQLIYSNFFEGLATVQIAAFISAFTHPTKCSTDRKKVKNSRLRQKIQSALCETKQMILLCKQCKLPIEQQSYLSGIKQKYMDIVIDWANGCSFQSICLKSQSYEGIIIQFLKSTSELIEQMMIACKQGNKIQLSHKFTQALFKINRGIVLTSSLYIL